MTEPSSTVRRGTFVVATRDEKLTEILRSLQGQVELDMDIVSSGPELVRKVAPPGMLPHEGDGGGIKIVLLDDDLAGARGRTVIRSLRESRADLKIIFAASNGGTTTEIEARRLGVYFFLPKPINAAILRRVLAKAVEHESTRNCWKKG